MDIAVILIGLFAVLVGTLIYSFERPSKQKRKLTGRGGDFEG